MNKKSIRILILSTILPFLIVGLVFSTNRQDYISASAHSTQLTIDYDECCPVNYVNSSNIGDGEDEKWYELIRTYYDDDGDITYQLCYHLPHSISGTSEIKYYISNTSLSGPSCSWNYISDSTIRENVKTSFVNSIKKWNNVYFYQQTTSSLIYKKKIVNIIEGTSTNHNLVIYPSIEGTSVASCIGDGTPVTISDSGTAIHRHYENWNINIDLTYHKPGDYNYNANRSAFILERTGAHEFGHVLGLCDIDKCEELAGGSAPRHHEELLMGYSSGNFLNRQSEITYKDLVGAAITRGYHTDSDHQWIYDNSISSSAPYRMICSICNGVKYLNTLPASGTYKIYKGCSNNHNLSSGNMFAVASYNNLDYYKCKYCRYVAPFTDLEPQDYTVSSLNSTYHRWTSDYNGLDYYFDEEHHFENGYCTVCGQLHPIHNYDDEYIWMNKTKHKACCECGDFILEGHAASPYNTSYCMFCGGIMSGGIIGPGFLNGNITIISNDSILLPNGNIIIGIIDYGLIMNGEITPRYIYECANGLI